MCHFGATLVLVTLSVSFLGIDSAVAFVSSYSTCCSHFRTTLPQVPWLQGVVTLNKNNKARTAAATWLSVPSSTGADATRDKALPPGRPTSRLINFLFDDTMNLLNPRDMKLLQRKSKFGPIFKSNFLFKPCVFVTDEASIQELAKEEARKSLKAFFPPHHKKMFGPHSLLVVSGEEHAKIRKLLMTTLSPNMIQSYEPLLEESMNEFFNQQLANVVEQEDNDVVGQQQYIPMVPKLRSFFMSIVLRLVLGTKDVSQTLIRDIEIWSKGLLAPPLAFVPFSTAGKAIRARKRIVNQLSGLMLDLESASSQTISNNNNNDHKKNPGLLFKLMNAKDDTSNQKLTRDEILDNLFTLVFAGSDTTSSAALSIWKVLSEQPQVTVQLKENPELIEAFVERVLEAYPPAPFNMRQVGDEDLEIGKYRIPAHWLVAYGYAAALDGKASPAMLAEPLPVSPEASIPTVSLSMAFGRGPRRCPGRYLAGSELQIFTKVLLKKQWELDPNQNLEQIYTPGFFPVDGFKVRLRKST